MVDKITKKIHPKVFYGKLKLKTKKNYKDPSPPKTLLILF